MFSFPTSLTRPAGWRRRTQVLTAGAAVGGLVLASQVLPAEASPSQSSTATTSQVLRMPPDGRSWFEGMITDQAGHPLNNVNVEVWPTDVSATVPVASNLSYGGVPADGAHQNGVFRVEVTAGATYRISVSTVGGVEDADKFRMKNVGGGAPIAARTVAGTAFKALAGRTVDLGTIQLARQGKVTSKVKVVKPRKVTSDKRAKLAVRVSSRFVTHPTGLVRVNIGRKTVLRKLGIRARGRVTILLPRLAPGTKVAKVTYLGSRTVSRSKAKPIRIKVTGR